MTLHHLVGHLRARQELAQAVGAGRLPQLLLLTGPEGVGKQRLALWVAQLALCAEPAQEPCGSCRACRLVTELTHPDLHWVVPVARPKEADPGKQMEALAEAVGQVMTERRANPLYGPIDGMAGHFVATARLLQRHAALTPVEGRRKIFIVGGAERLVPQEASQEAANALLKLFEEPPADTHVFLTAADPGGVLPTIRSRAVPVRLRRLSDEEVRGFLEAHLHPVPRGAELSERVARAAGSIGAALGEDQEGRKARQAATELLEAVLAGPGPRLERALKQGPWAARGDFTAMLDALSETLGDATRASLGHPAVRPVPDGWLRNRSAEAFVGASERVTAARDAAQGNVNPQLLLAVLGEELAEIL